MARARACGWRVGFTCAWLGAIGLGAGRMVWFDVGETQGATASSPMCANGFCQRSDPGDGPTCRWHIRNYGTEAEPEMVTLCNACKINFDQQKYCPYCLQIYKDKDPDGFDGKEWVGCVNRMRRRWGTSSEDDQGNAAGPSSQCRRWVHVECEEDVMGHKVESRGAYLCPSPACRKGPAVHMRGVMPTKRARSGGSVVRAPKHTYPGAGAVAGAGEGAGAWASAGAGGTEILAGAEVSRKENQAPSWEGGAQVGSGPKTAGPPHLLTTPGRSRRKKPALVNLARLHTASLRKYKRAFNLSSGATKQELQDAVAAHFANSTVTDEHETLSWFVLALSQNKSATWRDGVRERNG